MKENIKSTLITIWHNEPFILVLPIMFAIPLVGIVAILITPSPFTLILIGSLSFIGAEIAIIFGAYRKYSIKSPSVKEEGG